MNAPREAANRDRTMKSPACDKAQQGLALLKEAVVEELARVPDGLRNAEIADALEIRSDYAGAQKDFLSWSILGLLLNEGRIIRVGRRYFLA